MRARGYWSGLAAVVAALIAPAGAHADDAARTDAAAASVSATFSELASAPHAPSVDETQTVESYLNERVARVRTGDGRSAVVVSSAPLVAPGPTGASIPVDLTLRDAPGETLIPTAAATTVEIPTLPGDPFRVGPDRPSSITITPLDVLPDAAVGRLAGQVLMAGTHEDTDLLFRQQADGVETYDLIHGPAAPESLSYRVGLADGQRLVDRGAHIEVLDAADRVIVTMLPPVSLDADRRPVPTSAVVEPDGVTVTVTARHRAEGVRYPVVVDPDWTSSYDYAGRPGLGLQGWRTRDEPVNPLGNFYDAFVNNVADPVADPDGDGLGFFVRPRTNGPQRVFPVGVGGELYFNAPGTTHIRSIDFTNVTRFNDRDRQTLRFGLYGPNFEDVDDAFAAEVLDDDPVTLPKTPFPTNVDTPTTTAIMRMFTAPCVAGQDTNCPPTIRSDTASLLRVGSVQITLTDFDLPVASIGGSITEIAGRWTNTAEPKTVVLAARDAGSGVAEATLDVMRGPSRQNLINVPTGCRPDHDQTDPPQGTTICPETFSQPATAPIPDFPDGPTTFIANATDPAGNRATAPGAEPSLTIYLDRRAPKLTVGGDLTDRGGAYFAPDQPSTVTLSATDTDGGQGNNSGILEHRLVGTDESGAVVYDRTSERCAPPAPSTACDPARDARFTVDPRRFPEGEITFVATTADLAGNPGEPVTFSARIDRTPPAARASGALVDLADRTTNTTGDRTVRLDAKDLTSGVASLSLVARNSDGDTEVASVDVCGDREPGARCPQTASRTVTVDAADLPEGATTFVARARDLAGLRSVDEQDWETYLDRTPPPPPDTVTVEGVSTSSVMVTWPAVADLPEGSGGVSYEYMVMLNGAPMTGWLPTDANGAQVGGLPAGVSVSVLVRAVDIARNAGQPASGSGRTATPRQATGGGDDFQNPCPLVTWPRRSVTDFYDTKTKRTFESDIGVEAPKAGWNCAPDWGIVYYDYKIAPDTSGIEDPPGDPSVSDKYKQARGVGFTKRALQISCIPGKRQYVFEFNAGMFRRGALEVVRRRKDLTVDCNEAGAWRVRAFQESKPARPSSKLEAAMALGSETRPGSGYAAHHIIPTYFTDREAPAVEGRGYACRIRVNSAANGLFLPAAIHRRVHNKTHYRWLLRRLQPAIGTNGACNYGKARDILGDVKSEMKSPPFPGYKGTGT